MALQKFPVVLPLGGAVDEGTVTELVQPPRIQSADDCASVKGGAYQKRDRAEASDPDTGNPRGIAAAPFGIVGVTPDECRVLKDGVWDQTAGNAGALPGAVNPFQVGTDDAAPLHTCDTAVIDTPGGRVRCVVYQVGPTCVGEVKVANTGAVPGDPDDVYTFYPMVWQTVIQADGIENFGASNNDAGTTPNLNPLRAAYFQLFDDATDAALGRPVPLADFSPVLIDAPKVLPLDDGFLITAWDLDSPTLIGLSGGDTRGLWYPALNGQTIRNPASKGFLRIDAAGAQVALWTGDGGEVRDWVRVGEKVFGCHARQTGLPYTGAPTQTTLVIYDLATNAVSESAPVGSGDSTGAGDTIDGAWVALVGLGAITSDLLMCVASSGATARYTISADTWITQPPLAASGGMRGRVMYSGGGFLQGCGTPGLAEDAWNGVVCGPPSCVGVVSLASGGGVAGIWVGVTTQNYPSQDYLPPNKIPNAFDSTEILFEHWFVNVDGEYVAGTHNYLPGAMPLSRAEPDPDSGLPHLYLYAGAKVWPIAAPSRGANLPTNPRPGGFGSGYNGTPVLARWSFYPEGKSYDAPLSVISNGTAGAPMAQDYGGIFGTFDSRYQLTAVYVGEPLSAPFYATVGNASNYRAALFTGGEARYECTAPVTVGFGEGVGKTYVDLYDIAYTGVAVTSALRVARVDFEDSAPEVIGTGERVATAGLYGIECAGPTAALGSGLPPISAVTSASIKLSKEAISPEFPGRYSLGTVQVPANALEDLAIYTATVNVSYHPSGELIRSAPVFAPGVLSYAFSTTPADECVSWAPNDEGSPGNGKGAPGEICSGPWPLFGIPPASLSAVEVYQSRGGQPFELIMTKIFPLEESDLPVMNSRADPLRLGYWESGELTPGPVPALVDVVSAGGRVFGLSAERATIVYYTKFIRPGYAIEWTRNLTLEFPEPMIGLAGLPDGRLIGFSRNAVYYTYGEGPSDTGQGAGYTVPQILSLQTGCQSVGSIASGDFGVIFRGPRGFYQIGRDLALTFIGLPYEDTTQTGTVVCTSIDAVRSEVHFYLEGGGAWIYNTLRGQWSSFTTGDAQEVQSATVANNRPMRWVADSATTGNIWTYSLTPAAAPALMSLQTGWLEMGRLQGFGRMWEVQIEGTRPTATLSALRVEVYYDYDASPAETFDYDDPGDHIKIRLRTARQKCEAVSFRFSEYAPPGAADDDCQGWNLSLCTLLCGVKVGLDKIPTTEAST